MNNKINQVIQTLEKDIKDFDNCKTSVVNTVIGDALQFTYKGFIVVLKKIKKENAKRICKNCHYWQLIENSSESWRTDDIINPDDPDTYEPMKTDFEMRLCKCEKFVRFERPPWSNGVSLIDGSEYIVDMVTGQDFGCIHFKEREV